MTTHIDSYIQFVTDNDVENATFVEKEADGRYRIVAVSTAAVADMEDETFTTKAMDFDIANAVMTGEYPEFRVFHKRGLGVGRAEKMSRVGIFAVDEGHSYIDPFSLEVCEKMLSNNEDGKWRVSRGFRVLKVSGGCPHCNEKLVVERKHMLGLGFKCPTCKSHHTGYKGLLKDVQFLETKTFDITITDVPAVPYTGVAAFRYVDNGEINMTRKQLKEKLLKAGLSEDVVEERLATLDGDTLKEFDDVPEASLATVFKEKTEEEYDEEDEDMEDEEKEYFTLDPSVLDVFADITRTVVKELLSEAELEVGNDLEIEVKESPILLQLVEDVAELKEVIDQLVQRDEKRLKEKLNGTSRKGKLRVMRLKETDMVDEEDEEEEKQFNIFDIPTVANNGVIKDDSGKTYDSMTELIK